MGHGATPPKSLRKFVRLGKAGLIRKNGKLVHPDSAFSMAKSRTDLALRRAGEKVVNSAVSRKEEENARNLRLNLEIKTFSASNFMKPYIQVHDFVRHNMDLLCQIMRDGNSLPAVDDEQVLSRKTFENLSALLRKYSLVFNGKEILKFNGEKL
jgi:predicted transcriptional regulator